MFRKTRKNPTATIKDFIEGPFVPAAVDADLASREIGFVDDGEGEGHFTVGGVPISGTLIPPGALWSSLAGKPAFISRSVAEFGAATGNTAGQNVTAFEAAVAWAEADTTRARGIFIPPCDDGEFYTLNAPIKVSGAGIQVTGTSQSRIKQTDPREPIFRACGPGQRYVGFHVIGSDTRNSVADTGGEDLIRDNHPFLNHCGVVFQAGSDGGVAESITGENINAVVACWAWSDDLDDYAGANIQGLTIRGIKGTHVWAAVFGRECDNLTVSDISGQYERLSPIFADPHLVYLTSSNYVETLRPLLDVNMSNIKAYDGLGGEPVKVSNIYGLTLDGLIVRNCPGALVLTELDGFTIGPYVAEDIWKDPTLLGVSHSKHGAQSGMLTISACKNGTVMPFRHKNKVNAVGSDGVDTGVPGNQTKAIVMSGTANEDVEILQPDITTFHATEDLADNRSEIYVYGTNVSVVRPKVKMRGAARNGVRMGGASPSLIDPEIRGCGQAIITDGALDGKLYDYNPGKITRTAALTSPAIRVNSSADSLTEVLTFPPDATVWDRGLYASPSVRVIQASSGHKPTRFGAAWEVSTDGRWYSASPSATLPRYAVFETGTPNVTVESDVWPGVIDDGGSGAYWAGHALCVINEYNNLLVEIRPDAVTLQSRTGSSGVTVSTLDTEAGTYVPGRRYRLRSEVFGESVRVYVDGVKVIDATITPIEGTMHGVAELQSVASQMSGLRITPLGTPVGSVVTPYDPEDDTDLVLWLDPTTLADGTVTTYADSSPAGHDIGTFTGTNTADMDGLNGTPCVLFGGSNRMRTGTFTGIGQPLTVMFNAQSSSAAAAQTVTDGQGGNTLAVSRSASAGVGLTARYSGTAASVTSGTDNDTLPHSVVVVFNGADTRIYIDGALKAVGDQTHADTITQFTIGSSGSATNYFQGAIGDVLISAQALTHAEALGASEWLADRRGA